MISREELEQALEKHVPKQMSGGKSVRAVLRNVDY